MDFHKKIIAIAGIVLLFSCLANAETLPSLDLKWGFMANYGASPWFTEDIKAGNSPIKFAPDSGAHFIWATSDWCDTEACNAHEKVNTSQPGFVWVDKCITKRSFGPWGSMDTRTGQISFGSSKIAGVTLPFFASLRYGGDKFKYAAWDGGIGFPSNTDGVEAGSGFYFGSLYASGAVKKPTFSIVTNPNDVNPKLGRGKLYLGGEDSSLFDADSAIELQPKKGKISYLWGTALYSASLDNIAIPSLSSALFYLDSGASRFKGDNRYIAPILKILYSRKDHNGDRIFDKVYKTENKKKWVGLVYRKGGPGDYTGILPDFTLTMGQACQGDTAKSARITLGPDQYSYKVDKGDYEGRWAPGFAVLDGVGGLLVGSVFLDLLYTTFNYVDIGNDDLVQGNMYLYKKTSGMGPKALSCVPTPETAIRSAIEGIWYNSYCSQVTLSASDSGKVTGTYTSHTGSTGSSRVVGWVGGGVSYEDFHIDMNGNIIPVNPNGMPVSLGIQWRLVNQPMSEIKGTWHWVSTFSGQYHPEQIVKESGQEAYRLEETLEILNGLIATSTVSGFAETAPEMWPQTLIFRRHPPSYCKPVVPPEPVSFTGTALDHISGSWKNPDGDTLVLRADMKTGDVSGKYTVNANNKTFDIIGYADTIASDIPAESKVAEQGVALTMIDGNDVLSMAGGVDLINFKSMRLWTDHLKSTNWTYRFMESTLDKVTWTRVQ